MAAHADPPTDSLDAWFRHYQQLAVTGVRSAAVAQKVALHLDRFRAFFIACYGHDRITTCLRRDVQTWQQALIDAGLAAATINNHLASLSACTTWIHAQAPHLFPAGDPVNWMCWRSSARRLRARQASLTFGRLTARNPFS